MGGVWKATETTGKGGFSHTAKNQTQDLRSIMEFQPPSCPREHLRHADLEFGLAHSMCT